MKPPATAEQGWALLEPHVRTFIKGRAHYCAKAYDETSARERFINRFFQALGWDVLDDAGAGARREVVFHERLRRGVGTAGEEFWDEDLSEDDLAARSGTVRIPDYAFRLGGRVRYFVEAKKPSVKLDTRAPAFQVKSYAWSERCRVGVLTNFAQTRVFACTTRPDYDDPRTGALPGLQLEAEGYERSWARIWSTLSRPAVAGGALDQLVGRTTPPGALHVGEAFLRQLEQWRGALAGELLSQNPDLDRHQLTEATQRLLDRIVFIRVCEDRGIEPSLVLRPFARRADSYRGLVREFRRLDLVYNGGLFVEHFSERLEVGDAALQQLVEQLYFPRSPYRFDVIGGDLLGSIYERFLGSELRIGAGSTVRVVEKPEVRQSGGVVYTPRWIVDELVSSTLDPLLAAGTPATAARLRILDPACGSGSFLLAALDHLINWHEEYYTAHPTERADRHFDDGSGVRRLTVDAKAELAASCLYGVDIDPQAVEVTQMSIYLRILQTEAADRLQSEPRLFHGPRLPSLASNLRCGNSLLQPHQVDRSVLYDHELARRVNPFDWHSEREGFGEVIAQRGGFDAIVGNPPYTRVQVLRRFRPEETVTYTAEYVTAGTGSFDISNLFVERALQLLRPASTGRSRGGGGAVGRQLYPPVHRDRRRSTRARAIGRRGARRADR